VKSRKAWVFDRDGVWYVGWYEGGQRRKKSFGKSKKSANDWCAKKSGELVQGISDGPIPKKWEDFVGEFRSRKTAQLRSTSLEVYDKAINHFERLISPKRIADVSTATVDRYTSKRLGERGKKPGTTASPATVNKELRALKRLFRCAVDWGYLKATPKIEFVRESKVGITFISEADFVALYESCDAADRPVLPGVSTADWWRALLVFGYMTGWRISEISKLLREDLDLKGGLAITRAADNKGRKESRVVLHPLVIEHLKRIKTLHLEAFHWPHDKQQLWVELHKIQAKAGIRKTCRKDHEHSDACQWYGFHDLRRGFATANAANLTASQLQQQMRHSSYATTQLYIDMAEQVKASDVVGRLSVPQLRKDA
jgi:integrase